MNKSKARPQLDLFRDPATDKIKRRLVYLMTLADRGATEGEKKAAKKAMARLISKYDLDDSDLSEITLQQYAFKYNSDLEYWLFARLYSFLLETEERIWCRNDKLENGRYKPCREIVVKLNRLDYITIECAWGYYRPHMNKEWKRTGLPELKKCRKAKTRNKKRKVLQEEFFSRYVIASKLYKEGETRKAEFKNQQELENALLFLNVEGGEFKRQVSNGLYLEAGNGK